MEVERVVCQFWKFLSLEGCPISLVFKSFYQQPYSRCHYCRRRFVTKYSTLSNKAIRCLHLDTSLLSLNFCFCLIWVKTEKIDQLFDIKNPYFEYQYSSKTAKKVNYQGPL